MTVHILTPELLAGMAVGAALNNGAINLPGTERLVRIHQVLSVEFVCEAWGD